MQAILLSFIFCNLHFQRIHVLLVFILFYFILLIFYDPNQPSFIIKKNKKIRVSSRISNGSIILNMDCDIYSNNSQSVRDVLCFFMDKEKGHEFGFVQFPQAMENLSKNDIYGNSFHVMKMVSINKQLKMILNYFIEPVSLTTNAFNQIFAHGMPCNKGGASRV